MQCFWFSFSDSLQIELNNFAERWNTHHIRSSKPNCIAGVPDPLFTSPEEYRYTNCGKRLSLAEPDHLKQQTDTEREAELSTFDLEDDAVMSYCMYIVQQLNLTYLPKSLTEVKDHNDKKRTNKQTNKQANIKTKVQFKPSTVSISDVILVLLLFFFDQSSQLLVFLLKSLNR